MRIFQCGNCLHPLFFENHICEKCGHLAGYEDAKMMMLTFSPTPSVTMISDREEKEYRYCQNYELGVCNWLIPMDRHEQFCNACMLNRTIPDLSDSENFQKWQKLEVAKHRMVYQLQRMGLSLPSKMADPDKGLCFDFISRQGNNQIMTGHANGIITILLSEADSVHREQMRTQLSEPYRTLIGHFRHEVGHYFWDRLIAKNDLVLKEFRKVFGDERKDYGASLASYYNDGAPEDWQGTYISRYATSHPWEDWAESWAHYLHIMDMTETAYFFGISVDPLSSDTSMKTAITFDPYEIEKFELIFQNCIPLSFAVNSLNRSMGIPDVYPFVASPAVVQKMQFIHQLVAR